MMPARLVRLTGGLVAGAAVAVVAGLFALWALGWTLVPLPSTEGRGIGLGLVQPLLDTQPVAGDRVVVNGSAAGVGLFDRRVVDVVDLDGGRLFTVAGRDGLVDERPVATRDLLGRIRAELPHVGGVLQGWLPWILVGLPAVPAVTGIAVVLLLRRRRGELSSVEAPPVARPANRSGRLRRQALAAAVVAIAAGTGAHVAASSGLSVDVVRTGSMHPLLPVGSLVVLGPPPADVAIGDVIAFPDPLGSGRTVLHRVVEERDDRFVTRGDANPRPDPLPVGPGAVEAEAVLALPRLAAAGRALVLDRSGALVAGVVALWVLAVLRPARRALGRVRSERGDASATSAGRAASGS